MKNVKIVLVHPSDDKNIGFVARAIKTMGIHRLVVISKRKIDMDKAAITAVHAKDILGKCLILPKLETAVENDSLIAGITRRQGKFRKYFAVSPEQLAERTAHIAHGSVALVFGNEKHGLSDRELRVCHMAVTIPSSPLFPSLNLSHAVQIIAYTLYRSMQSQNRPLYKPISKKRIDALARTFSSSLQKLGLYKLAAYDDIGIFFQDIIARSQLSLSEAERIESIMEQLQGILSAKNKEQI
ncbi:MAG: RNA methyltransferase [Spirochaetales bacterium]|nr:RNA methyltransferase [Spirochaetales bacterium]